MKKNIKKTSNKNQVVEILHEMIGSIRYNPDLNDVLGLIIEIVS